MKALVVDDEEKVRNMYKHLLRLESFDVFQAENGEEASLMLLQHSDIDLILLDIRMPVIGGDAFFDLIKLHSPRAKVIVTSVYPLDDQRRVIDNADSYHDKAEGTEMLLSRIRRVLPRENKFKSSG